MFSFIKKITKVFLSFLKKDKKSDNVKKSFKILKSASSSLNRIKNFFVKNDNSTENKNENKDILKEISIFILKEYGFGKYINLFLNFAKLLK
ncbi:hypothetical protein [Campylobacter sp. MG1]|uniref:hypothetical protein n=1 Tax=Campylobacter sp. MG1 TaxID=2976332 RepID=UPI00226C819D|nr:hypothetical protein [Campylobacter sp. MG1]